MVNNLVRNATVVLEDVEIGSAAGEGDLLGNGLYETNTVSQKTCEVIVIAITPLMLALC